MTNCRGFVNAASIVVFVGSRCVGLRWLGHSRTRKGHNDFIMVRASEPYVQQSCDLRVRSAQSGITTMEIGRIR